MEQSLTNHFSKKANVEETYSIEELDRHLNIYLETLGQYNECFEELQSHMKAAFFDLTKSKIALGPSRVGPNSYNLTSHLPITTIKIQGQRDWNGHNDQVDQSEFQTESKSLILSSNVLDYQASRKYKPSLPSSIISSKTQLASESQLRKRKPTQVADNYSNSVMVNSEPIQVSMPDEQGENTNDDAIQELPNPIHQFSALPPPSLRAAQTGFATSLESIVKLCNLRLKLFEVDTLVQSYKPNPLSKK